MTPATIALAALAAAVSIAAATELGIDFLERRGRARLRLVSTELERRAEEAGRNVARLARWRYAARRRAALDELAFAAFTGIRAGVDLALDELEYGSRS